MVAHPRRRRRRAGPPRGAGAGDAAGLRRSGRRANRARRIRAGDEPGSLRASGRAKLWCGAGGAGRWRGEKVESRDAGPGIADLGRAQENGCSTGGGLGGNYRACDA